MNPTRLAISGNWAARAVASFAVLGGAAGVVTQQQQPISCNAAPPAIDEIPVVAAVTEASTDAVKSNEASDFNELGDAEAIEAVEAVEAVEAAVPAKVRGPARYAAVFLDEASQILLKEKFPARFASEQYDHMTVHFAPSEEEREDINAVCGHTITLAVLGVAEDFYSQTLLVAPTDTPIAVKNRFPHITLSCAPKRSGDSLYGPAYSNTLLERLYEAGALHADKGEWKGVLNEFIVAKKPQTDAKEPATNEPVTKEPATNEPATKEPATNEPVTEEPVTKDPVTNDLPSVDVYDSTTARFEPFNDKLELTGTLCLDNDWDSTTKKCKVVPECAFCRFMKKGPCGEVFRIWENCVADSKDNERDFIDSCGKFTMDLKECIDSEQEYYGVLNAMDEEERDAEVQGGNDDSVVVTKEEAEEEGKSADDVLAVVADAADVARGTTASAVEGKNE